MKKLLLVSLLLISLKSAGSHIVGGEFELIHLSGNRYRVNLIYYFDKKNGFIQANGSQSLPEDVDPTLTAQIFSKSTNQLMRYVLLIFDVKTNVSYTQPACSDGGLETQKLVYTTEIVLDPETYNDPQGYYLSWQRCCRNYSIDNILSPIPPPQPNVSTNPSKYAGQTFYLEFPPVVKQGESFINSSPHLFPPLSDYACPFRPYYVDFAGVDDDGDSLVYSLVTPLNTVTSEAYPPAAPAPYPDVVWRPPFSLTNIMGGLPDLRISKDGLLTCTPRTVGLFTFAVRVEEFRSKTKIGESRRDFQMLVVDGCAPALPPKIVGKKLTDASFTYDNSMTVSFSNTVADGDRCIQVRVSDPDSERADNFFLENVKIKAIGLNFKNKDLSEILPAQISATLINGSTADFRICFPKCPYFIGGPYEVGIIAMDDACSLPLQDTLRVVVNVEPPVNHDPYFVTSDHVTAVLKEGDKVSWPFQIKDDDLDDLLVTPVTDGFLLASEGITFSITSQQKGLVNGVLTWDARCDIYDFTKRTGFQVKLRVEDQDACNFNDPVFGVYDLTVKLPGSSPPSIDTDLTTAVHERQVFGLKRHVGESLAFTVFGRDLVDNDFLVLNGAGRNFKFSDFNMTFAPVNGNGQVQSKFQWAISCDDFKKYNSDKRDSLRFQFIVVDNANKCRLYMADTVDVSVKIYPPDNTAPVINVSSLNPNVRLSNNQLQVTLGQQIALGLQGVDADTFPAKDNLQLTLLDASGNVPLEGFTFKAAEGTSPIETTWVWNPDCSIFQNGIYENNYTLTFRIADDRCFSATADTVKIKLNIKDVDGTDERFSPPNFFSPNDDGFNDFYSMEIKDAVTGELLNVLPLDNCTAQFQGIRIYNRWGNQVFQSTDRNFRWSGKGEAAGVYFYVVKYTHKEYKGALSIRF